jgi:hypothetical protein
MKIKFETVVEVAGKDLELCGGECMHLVNHMEFKAYCDLFGVEVERDYGNVLYTRCYACELFLEEGVMNAQEEQ